MFRRVLNHSIANSMTVLGIRRCCILQIRRNWSRTFWCWRNLKKCQWTSYARSVLQNAIPRVIYAHLLKLPEELFQGTWYSTRFESCMAEYNDRRRFTKAKQMPACILGVALAQHGLKHLHVFCFSFWLSGSCNSLSRHHAFGELGLIAKFCIAGKCHSELSGRPVKALFDPCLFVTIEAFVMLKTDLRFGYVLVSSALLKSNLMDDLRLLNRWKTIGCLVALLSEVAGITEYSSCPSSVRNIL